MPSLETAAATTSAMLRRSLLALPLSPWMPAAPPPPICCFCVARARAHTSPPLQRRLYSAPAPMLSRRRRKSQERAKALAAKTAVRNGAGDAGNKSESKAKANKKTPAHDAPMSLKDAMLGIEAAAALIRSKPAKKAPTNKLPIKMLGPADFNLEPVHLDDPPPVPKLAYGLDRVLFNPGVYRLQDPRSRVYNFDPYLEKIMPVHEFDFDALTAYKTSSKDETLLAMTRKLAVKYTGSTSSMSGILQHFHFLLSGFRHLTHTVLSKSFPDSTNKFSKITTGPDAVFLRYKDGVYALDADKTYDTPNVMSWLGHSLEKLLTSDRADFERFRRSSPGQAPPEDGADRCFHYTKQGSILMRSQLDAHDPRLPGTGVFDLKTRAVVSIRMNHKEYEEGTGYQLRYTHGEWESFEREFYDMTRATMLKYSLQVRMGRMDGIFLAYHNIERIFGFQYLSIADMDQVLHGQTNTCLGDQEFKLSLGLLEELMERATAAFPKTSIRFHFESRDAKAPFMYVFAEPVTEEQAEAIQNVGEEQQREFARRVVGLQRGSEEVQEDWQDIQGKVDEQVDQDRTHDRNDETQGKSPRTEAVGDESGPEASEGPLMGWTLTIRNKVNDEYVERPENLQDQDSWKIEYHVKEIGENMRWKTYNALKARRRVLLDNTDDSNKGLEHYRDLIKRYTQRGREWRQRQDEMSQGQDVQIYKPLGPGSDAGADADAARNE